MAAYSPFDKGLNNLSPEDLSALRQVVEGWYVEYKREVPNAAFVAKSISSFANTYGGWIFYGVEEKSKEEAVAGAFPGIPRADVDAGLQRIRQAVANQVNPSPHFDSKVLWGPCASVGLAADQAIISVQVPWSPAAPHVHKSGQIYRRVADGSEPRPESDRFVLDQLFRRADDLREQYREWIDRDPEFSKPESELPYLRLMLVADIWRDRDAWVDASLEEIRDIMGQAAGVVSAIPFDTVYSSSSGFVARQLKGNNPFNFGLTWRFRPTLVSEVVIPLHFSILRDVQMLPHEMDGYNNIERYSKVLIAQGHDRPRIVDLNFLFNLLVGVVEIQQRLLEKACWTDTYFVKARLLNVWRTVPYLDIPAIIERFEMHGVPMCLDGAVTTPGGSSPETFAQIERFADVDTEYARVLLQSLHIFAPIAQAYGLPAWLPSSEDYTPYYFEELQSAGQRAMEVQRLRNQRRSNI